MATVNKIRVKVAYTFQHGNGTITLEGELEAVLEGNEPVVWDGIQSNLFDEQREVIAKQAADIKLLRPPPPQGQSPTQPNKQKIPRDRPDQTGDYWPATDRQKHTLRKNGITEVDNLTSRQASEMISEIFARSRGEKR